MRSAERAGGCCARARKRVRILVSDPLALGWAPGRPQSYVVGLINHAAGCGLRIAGRGNTIKGSASIW